MRLNYVLHKFSLRIFLLTDIYDRSGIISIPEQLKRIERKNKITLAIFNVYKTKLHFTPITLHKHQTDIINKRKATPNHVT